MKTYEFYVDVKLCQWELQKVTVTTDIDVQSYEELLAIAKGTSSLGNVINIETEKTYDDIEAEAFEKPESISYQRYIEIEDKQ